MRRSQARVTYAYLALAGLVALLLAAGGWSLHGARPAPNPVSRGPRLTTAAGDPSPTGLDDLWAEYGHRASCAEWSGADGMQGIDLGHGTIAWFFSDTYLGPVRRQSAELLAPQTMINNSIVIESRHGAHADLATITGGGTCHAGAKRPHYARPVVTPGDDAPPHTWSWSAGGVRHGDTVLKFYEIYHRGGPRYLPRGTQLVRFDRTELAGRPTPRTVTPRVRELPRYVPAAGGSPIMWGADVLTDGGYRYVYGWQAPDLNIQTKRLYLARVPVGRLADLGAWRYYAGSEGGRPRWLPGQSTARPVQPPGADLAVDTGFSVVRRGGAYWLIQHEPKMFDPRIVAYPARTPWGPFDTRHPVLLFSSPLVGADAAHDDVMIYEARVDAAESTPRRLVISYSVNTVAVDAGCVSLIRRSDQLYRPRFISVPTSALTVGGPRHAAGVRHDPRGLPPLMRAHPHEWFNTWDSPTHCPPVPRIVYIGAHIDGHTVTLSWPSAGASLRYRVYVRSRSALGWSDYLNTGTTDLSERTLTGYHAHRTYEWKVVPVNSKGDTGPPITITRRIP